MADIINKATYLDIADNLAIAYSKVQGIADYYYLAADDILQSNEMDVELDLLRPFWNAYLAASSAYVSVPQSVIAAVASLQDHLIRRTASTNIDTALTSIGVDPDTEFDVDGYFKVLSSQAGYPIA